jgi:putative ABC transport system permease protein
MNLSADLISALRHFLKHKFRTALALSGIAVSVASIIVLTGVADAMRRDKARYFEEAGARMGQIVLLDKRGLETLQGRPHKYEARAFFQYDSLDYKPIKDWREIDRIKQACPNTVAAISPIVYNGKFSQQAEMSSGSLKDGVYLFGVTDDFFNCIAPKPVAGRTISREDMETGRRVVVLAWEVEHAYLAATLGDADDPDKGFDRLKEVYGEGYDYTVLPRPLLDKGTPFRLDGIPYEVIGLMPPDRPVLENFMRWNWGAFVPFPLEREITETGATNRFVFYPKGTTEAAFAELKPLLEKTYPGSTAVLQSAEAWAAQERNALAATTTGFLLIGLGTLIVSAMAVMNTMLVSVRERRLEIGIRKAMGASKKAIARQFTNETLLLGAVGAIAGIALAFALAVGVESTQNGILIPLLKAWKAKYDTTAGGWAMEPREWDLRFGFMAAASVIAAFVTMAVALVASLLPAREAAAMNPVASLRKSGTDLGKRRQGRAFRLSRMWWLRPFTEDPERTWLAVSAMAIGVAVVVMLTSIGEYQRLRAAEWAKFVGADAVNFRLFGGGDAKWEELPKFDLAFGRRLEAECPHVRKVWVECWGGDHPASLRTAAVTIDDEAKRNRYRVWGADAIPAGLFDYYPRLRLKAGQDFSQQDIDNRNTVCLLDEHAASVLFPEGGALGGTVEVGGVAFTVKGVIAQFDPYEREPWGGVRIPYSFHRSVLQRDGAYWLTARTTDPLLAREEIAALYEKTYNARLTERLGHFDMIGTEQAGARKQAWFHAAVVMALGIGTLVVGGIGMMNTMLISMTGRVTEIGILRALGATRKRIVGQFLFESVVLSLGGGIVGVAVGVIVSQYGLPLLCKAWNQQELWPTALSAHWPIVALLFAIIVGVISALGPALKASFIRPADALRLE